MEIHLTNEQQTQLSCLADQTGRSADELAHEAVDRYLTEEGRFHAGVQAGLAAAAHGDSLTPAEVWANVELALKA